MLMFGLRLGPDPRVVVTTTPKPIKIIRELIADPTTVITRGSTYAGVYATATGSMRLESLFLTLPTRALTGQQIMSSSG
jgi:phage terminase large subunit-like protein